jgi:hypothetical protein
MAIDAIINDVIWQDDGTAVLLLAPRDQRAGPAGQPQLVVLNPPRFLEAAIGTEIWGDHFHIYVGQTKWADRVGHGAIRLRPRKDKS